MSTNERVQDILDPSEQIIWQGQPVFLPFILSGLPFFLFGLVWAGIDYQFVKQIFTGPQLNLTLLPFILLHLTPFWLGLFNFARLFFAFRNTVYVLTNKRVIQRTGFWGIDFQSLDYDQIADIQVNVNPLDNLLGTGTILVAHTGATLNSKPDRLLAIRDPYQVYRQIKTTSVDVKTDWNYPNAIRPAENPGYQTKYDGQTKLR